MFFRMVTSPGLSHNSYIVGSEGKAAVIDPRRDCGIYGRIAAEEGLSITHIFETHRNEDYVTGSCELAAQCGAAIFHGGALPFSFGKPVADGDRFEVGTLSLAVLSTPGHTEESIAIALADNGVSAEPFMVFCGDTLFAGDIARTDFFGRGRDAEMAGKMYDSIHRKILPLGDGVVLCPAHGAGSVCGGDIADHPFTTVGYERRTNRYLSMSREEFVAHRIRETPYVPPYFRKMEEYNLNGPPLLRRFPVPPALRVPEVLALRDAGAQILDTRSPAGFAAGHIPGSISIWRDGVPAFAGWYLDYGRPIVIVDDFNPGPADAVRSLVRLGYDRIAGFLAGGFAAWARGGEEIGSFTAASVRQLHAAMQADTPYILDVRDIRHFRSAGHIAGAHHCYVGELSRHPDEIPEDRPVFVVCDSGFKGSLGAGFLAAHGFRNVANVLGGMQAWAKAGFPVVRDR